MLRTCRSFTGNERDLLSQEMYASEDSTYRDDVNFELCLLTMQRKRQHYVLHCKSNKCVGTELEDVMQKGKDWEKKLVLVCELWISFGKYFTSLTWKVCGEGVHLTMPAFVLPGGALLQSGSAQLVPSKWPLQDTVTCPGCTAASSLSAEHGYATSLSGDVLGTST